MKILLTILVLLGFAGASRAADEKPKPYPLKTCVVSGEGLDSMGKPFVFVYEGQEVKMCCKHCKKDFDKEPANYMKKIQSAE